MINYIKKDLTTVESGLVVHGTNTVGGFGSGIAFRIRHKWPQVYKTFYECGTGEKLLGTFVPVIIDEKLIVGNCYTQLRYGSDDKKYASPKAIKSSLKEAIKFAKDNNIDIISMPKIGAGLGGLDWDTEVFPIIEKLAAKNDSITFNICYIDII